MTDRAQGFDDLLQQAREGSEEAARKLVERYEPVIRRVIRRKLDTRLHALFDSDDFTQEVWAAFFARAIQEYDFDSPEELVSFLLEVARKKVAEANRRHLQRQKYDLHRECPLESSAVREDKALVDRHPNPSDLFLAREEIRSLLKGLPALDRGAIALLLEGNTQKEIAAQLGVTERTIRRVVRRAAAGWNWPSRSPAPTTR